MARTTRYYTAAIAALAAVMLSACVTVPVAMAPSASPVDPALMGKNLGPVRGVHSTGSIFGLWMIGRPDINKAIENALAKKEGATLINVRCYKETWYFFFFSLNRVIIEGDAVEMEKEKEKDKDAKKDAKKK